jgi:hypothetical protein
MATESTLALIGLGALDVGLVGLALLGYARRGSLRLARPANLEEAVGNLETSLWVAFPALPEGYTLRQALAFAKGEGVNADWPAIDASLGEYEESKFGGGPRGTRAYDEVDRLAVRLRRHGRFTK